jgi:hypothetical protein
VCAVALGLAMFMTPVNAQGPMYDRVNVNLPYSVTIGDKVLQPGDYVIQQLPDQNNSRVLLIYSDNGMKFETSAMTIPTLDKTTPENTQVVLHHFGPDYYFDKIWIRGKDYGYEFPLPNNVRQRERERMEPVSVTGNYQPVPESTMSAPTGSEAKNQAANEAANAPAATGNEPATQTAPATTTQSTAAPAPPEPAPATGNTGSADRSTNEPGNNDTMPKTAAGWVMMLLGGGAFSGAGLMLRRKH